MNNEGGFALISFLLTFSPPPSPNSFQFTAGKAEQEIVTYVLTIMNAVQLLFKQSSLGREVLISVVLMDVLKTQPPVRRVHEVAFAVDLTARVSPSFVSR